MMDRVYGFTHGSACIQFVVNYVDTGTSQAAPGRDNHPSDVKQFRLLHGSDFVLTYEDQDGDWMLVGDVPWRYVSVGIIV